MIVRELITVLGFRVDDGELQAAERRIKKVADGLGKTGAALTKFVTLPLGLVAGFALKASSDIESLQVSFETMLGSASKADKLIRQLVDFAAQTPFQMTDVQKNAQMLIGMGVAADDIIPTMKALGDVAAGVNQPLERIALNYGQILTQGKMTGRDLRDFAVQGVPIIAELARMLNVDKSKIPDMVSKGLINFETVKQAFTNMSSEGGRFYDLMFRRSKTLQGIWSNLVDSLVKLLIPIGDAITETFRLKEVLNGLIWVVTKLGNWFAHLNKGQKTFIMLLAAIAAAAGPVLLVFSALLALMVSINFVALGITALILAAIVVFALFVEDIVTWIQGGDSLVGALLGPWKEWRDGLFMIFKSISSFLDNFFEGIFTGNFDKLREQLETFTFIIKDVIKSFIADIEAMFGTGVGKFLRDVLGGAVRLVEGVATEAGTLAGGGLHLTPEQAAGAQVPNTYTSSGPIINFQNKVSFAPGTQADQQKQFLNELENITRGRVTGEIKKAIQQYPEIE